MAVYSEGEQMIEQVVTVCDIVEHLFHLLPLFPFLAIGFYGFLLVGHSRVSIMCSVRSVTPAKSPS